MWGLNPQPSQDHAVVHTLLKKNPFQWVYSRWRKLVESTVYAIVLAAWSTGSDSIKWMLLSSDMTVSPNSAPYSTWLLRNAMTCLGGLMFNYYFCLISFSLWGDWVNSGVPMKVFGQKELQRSICTNRLPLSRGSETFYACLLRSLSSWLQARTM